MVLTTSSEKALGDQSGNSIAIQPETLVEEEVLSLKSETVDTQAQEYDLTTAIKPFEGWRLVIVMLTLFLGLFLATVESSITATALVSIGEYFDDSFASTWVVLGYLLSYMGFSVIFARISDIIGRKLAILVSWFLFATFSLASGLAATLGQLIVFRIIQGVGGSGLFSMTMIVLPQVTPGRLWPLMTALLGAVFACSSIVGPVLGGVITQQSSWRWIYLFNAPAAALIVIPFWIAWPKEAKKNTKRTLLLNELDLPGAVLLLAASTLLVFALQQAGGKRYEWNSPIIIGTLIVSAVCWIGLFAWIILLEYGKTNIKMKAIFPVSVALQRPIGSALLMAFLTGLPLFVVVINLPTRFQVVNGDGPIMSGVHLLPFLAGSAFGSGLGGAISSKKNLTSYSLVLASSLMTIGSGLLSTLQTGREIHRIQYFYQVILGLGTGISMASLTMMVALECDFDKIASAQGASSQVRVLGGSIGLAVATILSNNRLSNNLVTVLSPAEIEAVQRSLETISNLQPSQQIAVAKAFAESFNDQMRLCLGVCAVSILVAVSTWQRNPATLEENRNKQKELAEAATRMERGTESNV